mgnify:CR=1 FL=1
MTISAKYDRVRSFAFEQIESVFVEKYPELDGKLRLTDISNGAMKFFRNEWKCHPDPSRMSGTYERWSELRTTYRSRFNKRLELAIWHEEQLCCVMLGRVSRRNSITGLYFVDGNNGTALLKGRRLEIATAYLDAFSILLGIEWIAIRNPYSAVEPLYKALGYTEKDPHDRNLDALCKRYDLNTLLLAEPNGSAEDRKIANF